MRCRARNGETGYWLEGQWTPVVLPQPGEKFVKIVLTVAHRDHTPENVDPANLFHACQRCHNRYDAPMRRAGIQARAREKRASGDLFQCQEVS
jgi:5-methylcytosine-specific restriction endonuclease McrA